MYETVLNLCDSSLITMFLSENYLIFCVNGLVINPLVMARQFMFGKMETVINENCAAAYNILLLQLGKK